VKYQVLHPHKSINKSIQQYVSIFTVLESKQKDKMFCTESYQIFSDVKINCVAKYRIPAVIVGKTFGYHRTLKVKLQYRTYVTERRAQ